MTLIIYFEPSIYMKTTNTYGKIMQRAVSLIGKEIDVVAEKYQKFEINETMIPSEMAVTIEEAKAVAAVFRDLNMRYQAAIKEVSTKLDILDNEFRLKHDYNPIHHMQSRIKTVGSIIEKIRRKGWPSEIESIYKITDFAGVRVICNYIEDIYTVESSLLRQDDIKLIRRRDYIKNPKESGYRSLHLVVEVPIFLSDRTYYMPVEIQIRTIAMDTWASLEHELKYKRKADGKEPMPEYVSEELKRCASSMAELDATMQRIHTMY